MRYFDMNGEPIEAERAWELMEDRAYSSVGRDVVEVSGAPRWVVSTVWLGLNHSFEPGPPLIFETMVFAAGPDGEVVNWSEEYVNRYATRAEAEAGHRRAVAAYSEGDK